MATQDKEKLIKRLKNKYRLTIFNETTFEELLSTILTPWKVIFFFFAIFCASGFVVYSVVALTPLKQYLVPNFTDFETRENARESRFLVDSLLEVNHTKDEYISRIKNILRGDVVDEVLPDTLEPNIHALPDHYVISEGDSILRAQMAESANYSLDIEKGEETQATQLLFRPLEGTLSAPFDPSISHFGIDVVAPQNEVVKAVQYGTVILASYTTDGGFVIQIQHSHNLLSVYKHNSALFKRVGDEVTAGESIAVIGNTGNHSDGPHLHFELWRDGVAENPENYFVFGE